jgi:hypothetical protein
MAFTAVLEKDRILKAAVSGSFHRHLSAITAVVQEFLSRSVRVLSPADPRVVANQGEFLFVASDRVRSVRLVQDRHLECIRAADFLWLVSPDGYVGQSAAMEVGFAAAVGVPILATHAPADLTLRQYVTTVRTLPDGLEMAAREKMSRPVCDGGLLVDPHASIEEAHYTLERIRSMLSSNPGGCSRSVYDEAEKLRTAIRTPTYAQ